MRCMASLCMWHLANFQYISKVLNPHFLASINKPPDLSRSPFISPQPLHSPLKLFPAHTKLSLFFPKASLTHFFFPSQALGKAIKNISYQVASNLVSSFFIFIAIFCSLNSFYVRTFLKLLGREYCVYGNTHFENYHLVCSLSCFTVIHACLFDSPS